MTETPLRRAPKQARSQQRVEHVLRVAAEVFAEVGYDAATTNGIAERAGVSIGSLYQFFPDKKALWDALLARYGDGMRGLMRLLENDHAPLPAVLGEMVAELAAFDADHAGFKRMFMDTSAAEGLHEEMVAGVRNMIARRFPALGAAQHDEAARVSIGIVKGLSVLSAPPDNLRQEVVGRAIVDTLLGYVRVLLVRAGVPLPGDAAGEPTW